MNKKRVGVDMPIDLYERLSEFADKSYDPMTRVIIKAVDAYINNYKEYTPSLQKINKEYTDTIKETYTEIEPQETETLSNAWENILDLFDYDESISIMTEEEFPKVKEYLFTLSEQELQLLWRKCSSHMFEVWENSPLIINFIDWAKEKLST